LEVEVDRDSNRQEKKAAEQAGITLTGGVTLSEERLKLLAPMWEATYRNLRLMDSLDLGDREPATIFVWKGEQR
jgi:hypothetical protein